MKAAVGPHGTLRTTPIQFVTTDDRKQQVRAAAASSARALGLVLVEVPEGWSASLLDVELTSRVCEELKLQTGEFES
jgi:hypothetical protein